jgi:hypothetical protein
MRKQDGTEFGMKLLEKHFKPQFVNGVRIILLQSNLMVKG